MKYLFSLTLLTLSLLALTGCHSDHDELFTTAILTIDGGDTIAIERVRATATLTNLNTHQTVSSGSFNGNGVAISVLRGAYQVSIEGQIRYEDPQQGVRIRQFRAVSDSEDLMGDAPKAVFNIIWMN